MYSLVSYVMFIYKEKWAIFQKSLAQVHTLYNLQKVEM